MRWTSALRGADLTRRLLAFARRQPLQPERTDINEVVGAIVRLLTRTLGENIAIELALSPNVWPVQIDRAQFEAVIANLATNARDAMPRGGALVIDTRNGRLDEAYAAVACRGHAGRLRGGRGQRFRHRHAAGRSDAHLRAVLHHQGAGQGDRPRAVDGVRLHEAVGRPHHGLQRARQGHDVPAVPAADRTIGARAGRSGREVPASRGGSETVLVVEDNAGLRRIVVRQLSEAGYRVLEAPDAEAAMTIIESPEPIDLLLTDIVMPGEMDGRDLARAAVTRRPVAADPADLGLPRCAAGAAPTKRTGAACSASRTARRNCAARCARCSTIRPDSGGGSAAVLCGRCKLARRRSP